MCVMNTMVQYTAYMYCEYWLCYYIYLVFVQLHNYMFKVSNSI